MSKNLDRVLDVLDGHDRQRSDEESLVEIAPDWCWRCGAGPVNPIGVCLPCAAWLVGDTEHDPAADDVYAPLDAATMAAIAEQITRDTIVELREMRDHVAGLSAKTGRAIIRLGDAIRSIDCQMTPLPAKTAHRRRYRSR